MAFRLLPAIQQVFSNLGEVGTGFKLKTYQTLTLTPLATYSDEALTTPNANPASGATTGNQIADSAGRFGDLWVDALANYKIILTDENDVTIDTVDPVGGMSSNSLTAFNPIPEAFWGTTSGTSSAYTLDSNVDISGVGYQDTQIFELAFHTTCIAAPTLNIDGLGALNLKKYTGSGTKTALEAGDVTTQTYLARNDGVDIIILNPEIIQNLKANNLTVNTTINGTLFSNRPTIANNGSDANNDIDFSAGSPFDTTNNVGWVASALTKRLDANWVAGTNQGGLFSGSKANSTTYHCFDIYNPTTGVADSGFDTSATAANAPSGFTRNKRLGSIMTDGSGNIRAFTQADKYFLLTTPINNLNTTSVAAAGTSVALTVPTGIQVLGYINANYHDLNNVVLNIGFLSANQTYTVSALNADFKMVSSGNVSDLVESTTKFLLTNTSAQIIVKSDVDNAGINSLNVNTVGWTDFSI